MDPVDILSNKWVMRLMMATGILVAAVVLIGLANSIF
jgi:hypothetical protein